jgi:FK506-binding protein 2
MLATALQRPDETVTFIFRDPKVFRNQLGNLSENANEVTTQVAPGGDNSQRMADGSLRRGRSETSQADQKVTVQQLVAPRLCTRGATTDDLLEISYLGTLADTGQVFDGSAVRINGQAIAGRGDDVTLYFVLGKQPFGQFPPGWDTGLFGMCVGERRRLVLPPVLAYGPAGLPRRGIPPDATLQYDITLVSLNGLATPQ